MKRKAFTLIELLAVIIILAVVALITVPIVLKIIDNIKLNSIKSSTFGYVDSIEKSLAQYLINNPNSLC